jgi:hypothetical protein
MRRAAYILAVALDWAACAKRSAPPWRARMVRLTLIAPTVMMEAAAARPFMRNLARADEVIE